MATQAQIEANRKNAQKSTGPKTPAGKAVVAQNAVTHGLRANRFLLLSDDPDEFAEHRQSLLDELAPIGPMESILANRIVALTWQLDRAVRFQSGSLNALASDKTEHESEEYVFGADLKMDHDVKLEFDIPLRDYEKAKKYSDKRHAYQKRIRKLLRQSKERKEQSYGAWVRLEDMRLGRIAFEDFSQTRVLERLMVYERRIENSLYKTQMQLERLQNLRRRRQAAELEKAMQAED
jgi:hypothetical protein